MILNADARSIPLADESVQCVVTSPPYWGLRDYGVPDEIGLEASPEAYVARLVEVLREVRRVLRSDGTLWLNLGDSYSHGGNGTRNPDRWPKQSRNGHGFRSVHRKRASGLKPKQLVGIPWRVALALQEDGWWLRSEVTWCKTAPMPESVSDRPTVATEKIFLLSKSDRYFYDAAAVRTPDARWDHRRGVSVAPVPSSVPGAPAHSGLRTSTGRNGAGANLRNWWVVGPQPFREAHFAVMPTTVVVPCIEAGSAEGSLVLDPFCGSGTTGVVARKLGRQFVGLELNPDFAGMARRRIERECPPNLFDGEAAL